MWQDLSKRWYSWELPFFFWRCSSTTWINSTARQWPSEAPLHDTKFLQQHTSQRQNVSLVSEMYSLENFSKVNIVLSCGKSLTTNLMADLGEKSSLKENQKFHKDSDCPPLTSAKKEVIVGQWRLQKVLNLWNRWCWLKSA